MTFSSAVILTDLNDYILPSQACVKPVEPVRIDESAVVLKDAEGYYQVTNDGVSNRLEKAKITIDDCLACSGCVTSAESVLVSMQSREELYKVLEQNAQGPDQKLVIVSIAPQCLASFAAKYSTSAVDAFWRIHDFLTGLGVHHVVDISTAKKIALLESGRIFVERYQQQKLPLLASSCPGWICYAEKTHPGILEYIDSTKSPQQIMGSMVKNYWAAQDGLTPDSVYHVTIMPCYDKKLEASRKDFYSEIYHTRDVDCVITTGEVERMLDDRGVDFNTFNCNTTNCNQLRDVIHADEFKDGSSSGGYLSFIMRYAAQQIFGVTLSANDIAMGRNGVEVVPGRNSDISQVNYTPPGASSPALSFLYAYGFRNIQNIVRKVKSKKSSSRKIGRIDLVEVMACPSGCTNGGGQLKDTDLASVEAKYFADLTNLKSLSGCPDLDNLYCEWLASPEKIKLNLHTQYHSIENTLENPLTVKW